jgi:hypothetical protein
MKTKTSEDIRKMEPRHRRTVERMHRCERHGINRPMDDWTLDVPSKLRRHDNEVMLYQVRSHGMAEMERAV